KKTKNIGRTSLRELNKCLEKLAEHGMDYIRYGDQGAPPASIDELIALAFQSLSEKEERILTKRYLEQATLSEISPEYGVTRERIRQKTNEILKELRVRTGAAAQDLTERLVEASQESGELLHRDTAFQLTGSNDLHRIWLCLMIAGQVTYRIWREEFLTTL